jgi:hypothetical protein
MSPGNSHVMEEEIRAKLLLSDDQLLVEVGKSLGKGATFTDALKRGRKVVDNLRRELRTGVCSNEKVITCFKASESDSVTVVAAIIDAIAGVLGGVPPANIAVLLYRTGLKKYCGSDWPPEA